MSDKKRVNVEIRDGEVAPEDEPVTDTEANEENTSPGNPPADSEEAAEAPTEEEQLRQKLQETEDRLLRTAAEFENYKKRTTRQFELMAQQANERLLTEILEVVDNFERALAHSGKKTDPTALAEGVKLIHNQLQSLLAKHDVKPIVAVGQPFDPNLHEALMQTPSEEHPEGHVALEMARGYRQGDRVLRYSKVAVSTGSNQPEGADKDSAEE
ncbi:MAG TPA: nucleotide exchange factor GrpE [candidate division Zixibacteria bacterium]|nr:nucleotide exchange factor GrpE [candidate division Zixibacteria bacterium]